MPQARTTLQVRLLARREPAAALQTVCSIRCVHHHVPRRPLHPSPAIRSRDSVHVVQLVNCQHLSALARQHACNTTEPRIVRFLSAQGSPETCVGAKRRVRGVEAVGVVRIAGLAWRAAAGGERRGGLQLCKERGAAALRASQGARPAAHAGRLFYAASGPAIQCL